MKAGIRIRDNMIKYKGTYDVPDDMLKEKDLPIDDLLDKVLDLYINKNVKLDTNIAYDNSLYYDYKHINKF